MMSIIPLTQHLFFENNELAVEPASPLDEEKLIMEGGTVLPFDVVERIAVPEILVTGEWWGTTDGRSFFLPHLAEGVDVRVMEKIRKDFSLREGGI